MRAESISQGISSHIVLAAVLHLAKSAGAARHVRRLGGVSVPWQGKDTLMLSNWTPIASAMYFLFRLGVKPCANQGLAGSSQATKRSFPPLLFLVHLRSSIHFAPHRSLFTCLSRTFPGGCLTVFATGTPPKVEVELM